MERAAIIETNIGDLIVALSEEAAAYARNENEVYKMVALMLTHLSTNSSAASQVGANAIRNFRACDGRGGSDQ